jgi:hypothetical protein
LEQFKLRLFIIFLFIISSLYSAQKPSKLYDEERYKEAYESAIEESKNGDKDSWYILGLCYYYGNGVEKNYQKAKEWFLRSSTNKDSQYYLYTIYSLGLGTDVNDKEAMIWLNRASDNGSKDAINRVGAIKFEEKRYKEALILFQKASNLGSSKAFNNLGLIYMNGLSVKKDYYAAKKYFEKSIEIEENIEAIDNIKKINDLIDTIDGDIKIFGHSIKKVLRGDFSHHLKMLEFKVINEDNDYLYNEYMFANSYKLFVGYLGEKIAHLIFEYKNIGSHNIYFDKLSELTKIYGKPKNNKEAFNGYYAIWNIHGITIELKGFFENSNITTIEYRVDNRFVEFSKELKQ